jgi:hypothetical protein
MNKDNFLIDRRLARQKNLPWDQFDPIANAILKLIRAQNMLQSVHDASAICGDVPPAKYHQAYAVRQEAILALITAAGYVQIPTRDF